MQTCGGLEGKDELEKSGVAVSRCWSCCWSLRPEVIPRRMNTAMHCFALLEERLSTPSFHYRPVNRLRGLDWNNCLVSGLSWLSGLSVTTDSDQALRAVTWLQGLADKQSGDWIPRHAARQADWTQIKSWRKVLSSESLSASLIVCCSCPFNVHF